jgi:3-oxoadipate enol-lactonase
LCVAGGQDAACPVVAVKEIATQIPGAEFVVIPDAPHMMQIETPDSFVRTITPFVQRLAPVASHSVEGA